MIYHIQLQDPVGRHYCEGIPPVSNEGDTWTCPLCYTVWTVVDSSFDDQFSNGLIWECESQAVGKLPPDKL
jgi:hypothetical protein